MRKDRSQPDLTPAARRIKDGSKRGSQLVSAQFGEHVTRRRYCETVGIHATTLRRWEAAGVVRPRLIRVLNSPTHVFSDADVALGKRIVVLVQQGRGQISLVEAAHIARTR